METFMTQLIVLLILALTGAVVWHFFLKPGAAGTVFNEKKDGAPAAPAPKTAAMSLWDIQYLSPHGVRTAPLLTRQSGFSIGTSPDCDFVISDAKYVSQIHARIYHDDKGYYLVDAGSTNGTFDDRCAQIEQLAIEDGSEAQLADAKIRFVRNDPFNMGEHSSPFRCTQQPGRTPPTRTCQCASSGRR